MSTKLVPEIKEKWINALVSGAYKKGKYYLHNQSEGSYCCLGVLCEVYKQETGLTTNLDGVFPDDAVMEWAFGVSVDKIKEYNEEYPQPKLIVDEAISFQNHPYKRNKSYLTELNDESDWQRDFTQIAKIIEEQL